MVLVKEKIFEYFVSLDVGITNKAFWQNNILHIDSILEQWSDLLIPEPSDAATDASHEKLQFRVSLSELDKLIHKWLDSFHPTLHRRDTITLSLQSNALSPDSPKLLIRYPCSAPAMTTRQITAKHKSLILFQLRYPLRSKFSVVHNIQILW